MKRIGLFSVVFPFPDYIFLFKNSLSLASEDLTFTFDSNGSKRQDD
jgi:hypothetical protein